MQALPDYLLQGLLFFSFCVIGRAGKITFLSLLCIILNLAKNRKEILFIYLVDLVIEGLIVHYQF